MSQSARTLHEFGSLAIKEDLRLKLGSSSALSASISPAPTALADADATLTIPEIRSGLLIQTPTAARNITLPTAAELSSFLGVVGDSIDFHVINAGGDTFHSTIVAGTGGSIVGSAEVRDSDATTASSSGSAHFRLRQTGTDTGSESYVLYRLS